MNILLSGYGKMGKEVEKAALQRNHTISGKIDFAADWDLIDFKNARVDVVIDFSLPDVAVENIKKCFDLGLPLVIGTTGWYNQLGEIGKLCAEKNGSIFYAPNFSIGVNIFFLANKKLARLMSSFHDYRAKIEETHHIHKLDAPSGTAIKTAEDLIENHDAYASWVGNHSENKNELEVISFREDEVPGTHIVTYESDADIISLKHEAKNRSGFAMGAVLAAEFIQNKRGVFTMADLFNTLSL